MSILHFIQSSILTNPNPPQFLPITKMSTKGTVLISGVNGYIASRTVETFLKAGYSVRGTVRSLTSAKGLQVVLKKYVEGGKLSIVEVPDITKDGAFNEAVKGIPNFHLRIVTTYMANGMFTRRSRNSPHGFPCFSLLH